MNKQPPRSFQDFSVWVRHLKHRHIGSRGTEFHIYKKILSVYAACRKTPGRVPRICRSYGTSLPELVGYLAIARSRHREAINREELVDYEARSATFSAIRKEQDYRDLNEGPRNSHGRKTRVR